MVHTDSPEERQARSEGVNRHAGIDTCTQILQTVSQRVCQLDVCSCTCLLHVVTRDRDRVELGHILRGVLKDVSDNLHRELGRIDIGVTHHKLLQDIVLNGTRQLLKRTALLQTGNDVECQYRKHCSVHGHRHRHLVQRNAVEQYLHILNRADRNTCLTYVTDYTRVVGIVATVCCQVERYRQTLLACSEVTTVECVRLLGSRETCILTNSPGTHNVHCRVGTTQEGSDTCCIVQVLHALEVCCRIISFDGYSLGSEPRLLCRSIVGTTIGCASVI